MGRTSVPVTHVTIWIPGPPPSKGRPRFGQGRVYTDHKTRAAEDSVAAAWLSARRPRLKPPLHVSIVCYLQRPQNHFRSDGVSLSAAGEEELLWSCRRPDVDNIAKAVLDALHGLAWKNDTDVTSLEVQKRWANPALNQEVGTTVMVCQLNDH